MYLLIVSSCLAQQEVGTIRVGDLWETPDGLESAIGLQGRYLVWPGGGERSSLYEGGMRTNSSGAIVRLMFKDFQQEIKDSAGSVIGVQTLPFYHPGYSYKSASVPYTPTQVKWVRVLRTPTKVIYEDGSSHQTTVDQPGKYLIERSTLIADEMVEYTEFYRDGFYVKSSYYAWANPYHDDYIIRVVDIVNNGNLDDVPTTSEMTPRDFSNLYLDYYVNNFSPNGKGEGQYSYKATGTTDNWHDYYGDSASDSLRFMYAFDGDDPTIPGDDQGDPFPPSYADDAVYNPEHLYSAGEFVSAMVAAYGVLHVGGSTVPAQNDMLQPFAFGFERYNVAPGWREGLRWANVFNGGTRSFVHPDYTRAVERQMESCWMAFGPFNLPAYGRIKLVFVHAVNGPRVARCKEMGFKYLQGQITKAEKDAFIASSFDSLKLTIQRAQWNWNDYLSKNKSMPNAPMPPTNLVIKSAIGSNMLSWTASRSNNVAAYCVYRKAGDNLGDCEKIADVPSTQCAFVDSTLDLGVSYYYYVTSRSDGSENVDPTCLNQSLESSKFFNRSYHPARAYRSAASNLSRVRVVPNPYNIMQARTYPGEADRLTFTNLPRHCIVRVFTVSGDLVRTLQKNDDASYLVWTPMLTEDNLFIAPDVYIYHVEDQNTGDATSGRFVVVR